MEMAIAVRNLTKVYGTGSTAVHALHEVSLDVSSGEVLLIMGPSGSGKTTLLSIMGGILRATSGSVLIHQREIIGLTEKELPRLRRTYIGFVFQGFNLFPALSAGENVAIALDIRGIRGREAHGRAVAALERVGLGEKVNALPADLSGGQKQRVAIARALIGEPKIILADEPTAALDANSGATVVAMLSQLAHEHGRAVVMVTHDHRTLAYADRIVYVEDGTIREQRMVGEAAARGMALRA
jgi:putative ABC transport system ATP-binding protein